MRGRIKYGPGSEERLREAISEMLEEAIYEEPERNVVNDLFEAVSIAIEGYANCKEFARIGMEKRRWYEATIYISAEKFKCELIRGMADSSPPP